MFFTFSNFSASHCLTVFSVKTHPRDPASVICFCLSQFQTASSFYDDCHTENRMFAHWESSLVDSYYRGGRGRLETLRNCLIEVLVSVASVAVPTCVASYAFPWSLITGCGLHHVCIHKKHCPLSHWTSSHSLKPVPQRDLRQKRSLPLQLLSQVSQEWL